MGQIGYTICLVSINCTKPQCQQWIKCNKKKIICVNACAIRWMKGRDNREFVLFLKLWRWGILN